MTNYCGPIAGAPWDAARWPNFTPAEIACRCCGEVYLDPEALDALQKLRGLICGPLRISSGPRCERRNARVGGAPHSVHRQLAFDIELGLCTRGRVLALAHDAGFRRFGLMLSAIHVDTHLIDSAHAVMWTYGPKSCAAWAGLYPKGTPDIGGA